MISSWLVIGNNRHEIGRFINAKYPFLLNKRFINGRLTLLTNKKRVFRRKIIYI